MRDFEIQYAYVYEENKWSNNQNSRKVKVKCSDVSPLSTQFELATHGCPQSLQG